MNSYSTMNQYRRGPFRLLGRLGGLGTEVKPVHTYSIRFSVPDESFVGEYFRVLGIRVQRGLAESPAPFTKIPDNQNLKFKTTGPSLWIGLLVGCGVCSQMDRLCT